MDTLVELLEVSAKTFGRSRAQPWCTASARSMLILPPMGSDSGRI